MLSVAQSKMSNFEQTIVSLPILVSINDLRNVVCALKKKPQGISIVEITDIFHRRLFEPCKLMAYQTWGIINYQNNVISLSDLGWQLADFIKSEANIYRVVLKNFSPYFSTLQWISQLESNLVISDIIINFWNENNLNLQTNIEDKVLENSVLSFFNLCHAAELGIAVVGRKGQPTRLVLDQGSLTKFLNNSNEFQTTLSINSSQKNNGISCLNSSPSAMRLLVSCANESDFSASIREI